jgi:alpha/beta superfamily hydrolase
MSEIFLNGPAGRIEGIYTESKIKNAPLALVLHPHPLYGGTMNNKVVFRTYKTLAEHGFTVLRFNFRGVGKSQGQFDNGVGEMTDAATALDWLNLNNPLSNFTLIAGFSFGAWIAMQLIMRRPEINNFIAISPPVNKYDFSFLSPCPISGLIVQGNQDSVVSEDAVFDLANRLSKQRYKVIPGADHFFRGKNDDLDEVISEYLESSLSYSSEKTSSEDEGIDESLQPVQKLQKMFLD